MKWQFRGAARHNAKSKCSTALVKNHFAHRLKSRISVFMLGLRNLAALFRYGSEGFRASSLVLFYGMSIYQTRQCVTVNWPTVHRNCWLKKANVEQS